MHCFAQAGIQPWLAFLWLNTYVGCYPCLLILFSRLRLRHENGVCVLNCETGMVYGVVDLQPKFLGSNLAMTRK